MGYDIERFNTVVDQELICPICTGVLEDPVQASMCEHYFCRNCINLWLSEQLTCPIDRCSLRHEDLAPVPRIVKNLLSRLNISCNNAANGCTQMLRIETLESHLRECTYNLPKTGTEERRVRFEAGELRTELTTEISSPVSMQSTSVHARPIFSNRALRRAWILMHRRAQIGARRRAHIRGRRRRARTRERASLRSASMESLTALTIGSIAYATQQVPAPIHWSRAERGEAELAELAYRSAYQSSRAERRAAVRTVELAFRSTYLARRAALRAERRRSS